MDQRRVVIMGAGGKDFHVFAMLFRGRPEARVVAFTAAQIPGIADRTFPAALAGPGYPDGIPIVDEAGLEDLVRTERIDEVVFAYSDVTLAYVAQWRARIEALGARFSTPPVDAVMLPAARPVVAVCAVRTGCGKSQTTRAVAEILRSRGRRVVVVRHPMPYGDLARQRVQRFATIDDLAAEDCTIEEMEEYEPHLLAGSVVFAGVDQAAILARAEAEADVILWDGGNNDVPFFRPDVWITVVDALRPGHELTYHPGVDNLERAHAVLVNKVDAARPEDVARIEANVRARNPDAILLRASSPVTVDRPDLLRGRRVLVVEDGPTVTHGGMPYGAGTVAALRHGATPVDPRPFLVGSLRDTFRSYPGIGTLLPAMGYGADQVRDLEATIAACDCDAVVIGTPIDLQRVVRIDHPCARATYALADVSPPGLEGVLGEV